MYSRDTIRGNSREEGGLTLVDQDAVVAQDLRVRARMVRGVRGQQEEFS